MRKFAIMLTAALIMLFAGALAWNAQATTVTSATIGARAKNYSPIVHETACRGWGRSARPDSYGAAALGAAHAGLAGNRQGGVIALA